jgi:hypothetical protein
MITKITKHMFAFYTEIKKDLTLNVPLSVFTRYASILLFSPVAEGLPLGI